MSLVCAGWSETDRVLFLSVSWYDGMIYGKQTETRKMEKKVFKKNYRVVSKSYLSQSEVESSSNMYVQ